LINHSFVTTAIRRLRLLIGAAIVTTLVAACAETSRQEATGKGTIRGINAIASAPELRFLIEERLVDNVSFKAVAGFAEYDDLNYTFNFDILLPDAPDPSRLASQAINVAADTAYTLVLGGSIAAPSITLWETAEREWAGTETVFETDFAHFAPSIGAVDIYFATTGTPPAGSTPVASLSNGERAAFREFPDGNYEVIVTPAGDPATILFQSTPIAPPQATRTTLMLFDPDPSITSTIGVTLLDTAGAAANIADARLPSQMRFLHAAVGTGNLDGYFNDDFATLQFADIEFGELSPYVDFGFTTTNFTLTDVGNTGAVVVEETVASPTNSVRTLILGGPPGALVLRQVVDEARPLSTFPVVRVVNMSVNNDFLDVYVVPPGTVIDDDTDAQVTALPTLLDTGFFAADTGSSEIVVTALGETTPLAMPLGITTGNGGIVDVMIRDTVDPATVELVIIEQR